MTLMGTCEKCVEEKPIHVPNERRRLYRGPDGRHLCREHKREAFGEYDDLCTTVGRPVAQESESGEKVELRTHSETVLLGDDDARELAEEILRVVDGHNQSDSTEVEDK